MEKERPKLKVNYSEINNLMDKYEVKKEKNRNKILEFA
jgi:hypothetical protein